MPSSQTVIVSADHCRPVCVIEHDRYPVSSDRHALLGRACSEADDGLSGDRLMPRVPIRLLGREKDHTVGLTTVSDTEQSTSSVTGMPMQATARRRSAGQ